MGSPHLATTVTFRNCPAYFVRSPPTDENWEELQTNAATWCTLSYQSLLRHYDLALEAKVCHLQNRFQNRSKTIPSLGGWTPGNWGSVGPQWTLAPLCLKLP